MKNFNWSKDAPLMENGILNNFRFNKRTISKDKISPSSRNIISKISNELRTPLSKMLGPIDSILDNNELPEMEVKLLHIARKNGDEKLDVVKSILDLNKLDAGKARLNEEAINLFEFTRKLFSSFESYAETSNVLFSFDYQASKELILQFDTEKLTMVVNNLISNALKFTPEKGNVSLKVEDLYNRIKISIKDSGFGVPAADLPFIFNRFYQASYHKDKHRGGIGIGLAIVKEFTNLMNGEIEVESAVNEGSLFTLRLLRKEVLTSQRDEKNAKSQIRNQNEVLIDTVDNDSVLMESHLKFEQESKTNSKNTILVVEDNYSIQDFIKSILSNYFNIVLVRNGREALDYLNTTDDLDRIVILSDIMMPIMDGYQFVEALKAECRYQHIPIIMLTAKANSESKLKALGLGANDYLLKPFEERELKNKLQNLFENKKHAG